MAISWDEYALHYDNLNCLSAYKLLIERFIVNVKKYVGKNNNSLKILDLGCGTGSLTVELAKAFPQSEIRAIDFSPEMLKVAQKKIFDLPNYKITFEEGDLKEITFTEDIKKYNLITLNNVLYTIDDKLSLVKRLYKILCTNGILIISDPIPVSEYSYLKIFKEQLRSFKSFVKTFSIVRSLIKIFQINKTIDTSYERFGREEYTRLFKRVGFIIEHHEVTYAAQANLFVLSKKNV